MLESFSSFEEFFLKDSPAVPFPFLWVERASLPWKDCVPWDYKSLWDWMMSSPVELELYSFLLDKVYCWNCPPFWLVTQGPAMVVLRRKPLSEFGPNRSVATGQVKLPCKIYKMVLSRDSPDTAQACPTYDRTRRIPHRLPQSFCWTLFTREVPVHLEYVLVGPWENSYKIWNRSKLFLWVFT